MLEEENAALKRQQIELNLQLMEHEQTQLMGPCLVINSAHFCRSTDCIVCQISF